MPRPPRSTSATLVATGGLVLLGALLWYSPWIYRVMTERLTLYRTCVEWSRDSGTLGEWTYTRASCFSQATRRRHKSLLDPHRGIVEVERVEVVRGGGGSSQHGRNLTAWSGLTIPATSARTASFA
jgi:hypothetical protein